MNLFLPPRDCHAEIVANKKRIASLFVETGGLLITRLIRNRCLSLRNRWCELLMLFFDLEPLLDFNLP